MRLENDIADIQMIEHYPTEWEAKQCVEQFLRSYEVYASLHHHGRKLFHFEFDKAGTQIVDPSPTTSGVVNAFGTLTGSGDIKGNAGVIHSRYPRRPEQFVLSPNVEIMWKHYECYRLMPDLLAMEAYWCLRYLEYLERLVDGGNNARKTAAKRYKIPYKDLDKLGKLTSTAGDEQTSRKSPGKGPFRPFTQEQKAWIEATFLTMILRVGKWEARNDANIEGE
jgi:hypothetical protein